MKKTIKVEISVGEAIDKLSILQIKLKYIKDQSKLKYIKNEINNIEKELELLGSRFGVFKNFV